MYLQTSLNNPNLSSLQTKLKPHFWLLAVYVFTPSARNRDGHPPEPPGVPGGGRLMPAGPPLRRDRSPGLAPRAPPGRRCSGPPEVTQRRKAHLETGPARESRNLPKGSEATDLPPGPAPGGRFPPPPPLLCPFLRQPA